VVRSPGKHWLAFCATSQRGSLLPAVLNLFRLLDKHPELLNELR
jgi:hypothetical protein